MVPVVSLLALWGFATVSTAQDIADLSRARQVDAEMGTPVAALLTELQAERRASVRFLADPASDQAGALTRQAGRTDAAVRRLRLGDRHTVADSGDYRGAVVTRLRTLVADAEALTGTREDIAERRLAPDAAYEAYTRVTESALTVEGALSGGEEAEPGPDARILLEFDRAGELLSREDALLALPGPRSADALRRLTGTVATRRALTETSTRDLPAAQRAAWDSASKTAAHADLTAAEDKVLAATPAAPNPAPPASAPATGPPAGWESAYTDVSASMREVRDAVHRAAIGRADPVSAGVLSPAGAAVLLGLVAVAASLVISVRIGRALVVELVSLRNTALDIAHRKLPDAMDRLRAGQEIDVEAETPPGPPADDEVTQVGAALATVHRAALGAAVERAELASGVSGVFVNLARRSQVLVHKQLNLLDSMERRADDPGELGDLFRLDHLTTRMRRHAESLIILSGAAPGRAWRLPVPLTNVVRAAVSEIEDYPRVEVRRLAEAAVVGGAVADLTHLLAELIENAAQFSPPHTKVRVSGEPVGAGYVLEVEDRGLGMGREALADANRRIEHSEDLDLFDSDRLGLFVVSRLSARHGIRVHLRTSPYGGTTAVVLLPNSLLQSAVTTAPATAEPDSEPEPDREPEPEPGSGRQRAAARTARATRATGAAPESAPRPVTSAPAPTSAPTPAPVPVGPVVPEPEPALGSGRPRSVADKAATSEGGRPQPPFPAMSVVRDPARGTRPDPDASAPASAPAPVPESRRPRPAPVAPLRPRGGPVGPVTELPRRVRQASLVPQLREAAETEPSTGERTPGDPPGRTPEQARDRMAAYRAGWARGTQDNSPHAGREGEV
ncbi:nitrate- and nitrite sensing domain-containing protein [Streptomyces sp. NPDC101733]|uniref:sensor histidine kinase n=1 Tax=unclassified Streptomyces TaxID=2593676 RepID=UPI0037F6EE51